MEAEILIDDTVKGNKALKNMMWSQFYSSHQRFFKYLCIASKVSHAVKVAKQAVAEGNCAVIGLQSTGEARTLDVLEREDGELTEFISTAKWVSMTLSFELYKDWGTSEYICLFFGLFRNVFEILIENHFPAPRRGFLEDIQNANETNVKVDSPSPVKRSNRNVALKRKVLADLDLRRVKKKPRVVYTSDEDDENEAVKENKKIKSEVKTEIKSEISPEVKTEVNPEVQTEFKSEFKTDVKTEAEAKVKTEVFEIDFDSDSEVEMDEAESSGSEDRYSGTLHFFVL